MGPVEQQQTGYEEARQAGRRWAARQLELAGVVDVAADLEDTLPEAAAGYVALQTSQLPSLFFADFAQHQLELDMNTGFQIGASEALEERRQGNAGAHTLSNQRHEGESEGSMEGKAGRSTVFLAQISVEKPSVEDCIGPAVQALREVATRLEAGETEGAIYGEEGDEVASFGLVYEDPGP